MPATNHLPFFYIQSEDPVSPRNAMAPRRGRQGPIHNRSTRTMSTQINAVVNELRRRIVSGAYQPGERLVELQLAQELKVSRTPIRLAFEELTEHGLLERLPTRGFRVRNFNAIDLAHAIDVRGTLEGMAARLVAERGADDDCLAILRACVQEGRELVQDAARNGGVIDARNWMPINARFHEVLIRAAANAPLAEAIAFISKFPLAGATAVIAQDVMPSLEYAFIERAQQDHCDLVAAIESREGVRAESIMREHARRTRDNKRQLLAQQFPG